ncbi:MAG: stage 0 sporulation family protein [Treponema sp.]|jgi:cell fate regulator YaaT (PSP1 superfamily)|nr:stage 0 sporulation family protein [Treponema sp.]
MSDTDYTDPETGEPVDEDISALEDQPSEEDIEQTDIIVESAAGLEALTPDTMVYQVRLSYSHETFLAIYRGEVLAPGDKVLVPTRYGMDLAQIIGPIRQSGAKTFSEITRIVRPASKEDLEKADYNGAQEKEAFVICKQKIEAHRLEMKLVSVHYLLDEPKILFFFTADSRVDFRELVKDLVGVFKTRIELRQIGVRDESRVIGGLGICGRGFCCHMVSDKLKPVSIKMAKDQNLSLNSMKISGSCGRLLCCLAYEHCFYCEQRKLMPQEGCKLSYDGSTWKVQEVNAVAGTVSLNAEDGRQIRLPCSRFAKTDGRWHIAAPAAETVRGE